jgi:hypothetical protein
MLTYSTNNTQPNGAKASQKGKIHILRTGLLQITLRQNSKAEIRTNEEWRHVERASPTLRHVLQRNRRRAQMHVTHFTI